MRKALLAQLAGVALVVVAIAGVTRSAAAQPGTCWKCTYNSSSGTYTCNPAADGLGHSSCVVWYGQGCVLGSICGYYRQRGDGTFEGSKPPAPRRGRQLLTGAPALTKATVQTGKERDVERGCNGTIVRRQYGEETQRELARGTRAISI